jgi:hypothetical protein
MLSEWLSISSNELSKRASKYAGKRCVKARCFNKTDDGVLLCPDHTKEYEADGGFQNSPINSSKNTEVSNP